MLVFVRKDFLLRKKNEEQEARELELTKIVENRRVKKTRKVGKLNPKRDKMKACTGGGGGRKGRTRKHL